MIDKALAELAEKNELIRLFEENKVSYHSENLELVEFMNKYFMKW